MSLTRRSEFHRRVAFTLAFAVATTGAAVHLSGAREVSLTLDKSKITIAGTSNVHEYTASTSTIRIVRARVATEIATTDFWTAVTQPGALEAFEIAIPAATLSSEKDGLDKNMHKALKVQQHSEITFKLLRLQPATAGALNGVGVLRIAGVEREVALDLKTHRSDSTLTVKGQLQLLMTDYGITPPKAMLGMLKTDPKVTVTFETVLTLPLT
jgi:polyisoprenoid-binding protein YceI